MPDLFCPDWEFSNHFHKQKQEEKPCILQGFCASKILFADRPDVPCSAGAEDQQQPMRMTDGLQTRF